jgi:hypothetical protein
MKTKVFLSIILFLFTFSIHAMETGDTTVIILRPTIPSIPPPDNGFPNPRSETETNLIKIYYTASHLLINPNDFSSQTIVVTIKDVLTEQQWYEEEILCNTELFIHISSLPVGAFTISILDGDDEYVGEFEVF